jgi:transposase
MGVGTRRRRQRQQPMWIAHQELAKGPAHPFYQSVNDFLEKKKFDEFAEKGLAKESGIEPPTREDLARLDRKRKNKGSNKDWVNPHDRAARITKMKDGRTHLAHKAEHAVDLKSGAVLAVTLQEADTGDTTRVVETLRQAGENVAELIGTEEPSAKPKVHLMKGIEEVVGEGYHSGAALANLQSAEVWTYISEKKQPGQRHWEGKAKEQQAVYANRRRVKECVASVCWGREVS